MVLVMAIVAHLTRWRTRWCLAPERTSRTARPSFLWCALVALVVGGCPVDWVEFDPDMRLPWSDRMDEQPADTNDDRAHDAASDQVEVFDRDIGPDEIPVDGLQDPDDSTPDAQEIPVDGPQDPDDSTGDDSHPPDGEPDLVDLQDQPPDPVDTTDDLPPDPVDTTDDLPPEEPSDVPDDPEVDGFSPDTTSDSELPDAAQDQPPDTTPDVQPEPFPIRIPGSHQVLCDGGSTMTLSDIDHVCLVQIAHDNPAITVDAELYVQSSPYGCAAWGSPRHEAVGAWIRQDGQVEPLGEGQAHYDYGGNHHNDYIDVMLQGEHLLLYHSSFGWGWRACAPPDCALTCVSGTEVRRPRDSEQDPSVICLPGINIDFDGCERNTGDPPPLLQVLCVEVQADGTVPPLLDPWSSHAGEPDYPLLPCIGDI